MATKTEIAKQATKTNLPTIPAAATAVAATAAESGLTQGSSFLKRIQLFSSGKPIQRGLIAPGHFGIPESSDKITNLGKELDVYILAVRSKAVDLSGGGKNVVSSFDMNSDTFKAIVDKATASRDSGCMYGPSFLVYERTTGSLFEYFCGSPSARTSAGDMMGFMAIPPGTEGVEPRGPLPCTLKTRLIEDDSYSYFVADARECSAPIDVKLSHEAILEAVEKFMSEEGRSGAPAADAEEAAEVAKNRKTKR